MRKIKELEERIKILEDEKFFREFKEKPDEILLIDGDTAVTRDGKIVKKNIYHYPVEYWGCKVLSKSIIIEGHEYIFNPKYSSYELLTKVEVK